MGVHGLPITPCWIKPPPHSNDQYSNGAGRAHPMPAKRDAPFVLHRLTLAWSLGITPLS